MSTFVALLRGINVGKAKRIPMKGLRGMLAECGYTDVVTLLNSGNAAFRAPGGSSVALASEISTGIARKFGIDVPVIVKSSKELRAIVAENPFASAAPDHSRLLVAFAQDKKALASLQPITELVAAPEEFAVGKGAAYLHCMMGILESKAGEALLGKVGKSATTRNWATVLKLMALVNERDA